MGGEALYCRVGANRVARAAPRTHGGIISKIIYSNVTKQS